MKRPESIWVVVNRDGDRARYCPRAYTSKNRALAAMVAAHCEDEYTAVEYRPAVPSVGEVLDDLRPKTLCNLAGRPKCSLEHQEAGLCSFPDCQVDDA